MPNLQAIFQSANGRNGAFLDYCRERVESNNDAIRMAQSLARRLGCAVRVRVEHWNEPGEQRLPTFTATVGE